MTTRGLNLRDVRITALQPEHDLRRFCCGEPDLDRYINKDAIRSHSSHRTRVFCASKVGSSSVIGMYTLAIQTEESSRLLGLEKSNIVGSHFSALYLGVLAVGKHLQNNGLGTILLFNALTRAHEISKHAAFIAVALRSQNARTTDMYKRYGFDQRDESPTPLMILPIWSLIDLIEGSAATLKQ